MKKVRHLNEQERKDRNSMLWQRLNEKVKDPAILAGVTAFINSAPARFTLILLKNACFKSYPTMIRCKCIECSAFQIEEVEKCTVKTCPLWQYRPYQKKVSE